MSAMDEPDFAPSFARKRRGYSAGQRWQKMQPFIQEDVEVHSKIHDKFVTVKSWRPGVRHIQVGPGDFDADLDGEGFEVREIAAVVAIPGEVSRILYRKSWIDPTGKAFGKRKMHMTTPQAFSAWANNSVGFHYFNAKAELVTSQQQEAA